MPIYKEIEGNLITMAFRENKFWGIAHGCNCQKNWGAGFAKQLRGASRLAWEADMNGVPNMGSFTFAKDPHCHVFNLYTQFYPGRNHWGKDSNDNRYNAIASAFKQLNDEFKNQAHGKTIGIPLIGAGLAGLKWSKVKKMINQNTPELNITVVRLK